MKKVITLCLVVLICLSTAFAGDNYAGLNVGYSWSMGNIKSEEIYGTNDSMKTAGTGIGFSASGANYFTDSIGVGYSLGFSKVLTAKYNDITTKIDNEPMPFEVGLAFLYKYNFNPTFAIDAGIGLGYAFSSKTDSGVTFKSSTLGLEGKVGILATLQEHFALGAGINFAIPLMNKVNMSYGGLSKDINISGFQFGIGPYISLMYRY